MEFDPISRRLIGLAIEVHRTLGPGLLESVYEECLCHELDEHGIPYRRQAALPVTYKSVSLDCAYRLDLIVNESVIVELKAVDKLLPIHEAQLLTYLKLTRLRVGLLINFNVEVLKSGLRRLVL